MDRKKILIISVGPVPATSKSNVEGGGLRAWGLAQGLKKNGIDVTIAVPIHYELGAEKTDNGIEICHWSFDDLKNLFDNHDAVYVLYSWEELMNYVFQYLKPEKQLIVDLYVPIYIESLARERTKDLEELKRYRLSVESWNKAFPRGDYFLCANQTQYHYYNGVLSTFGRINSLTFGKNQLDVVPYGIHNYPIIHDKKVCRGKIIKDKDFMLLWFGGLYPWFDIKPLLFSIKKLSNKYPDIKLVIVGGRNPFVTEPGFMKQYNFAVEYSEKEKLKDKNIFFVDWIPYDERNNWYLESDLVINLHHKTKETIYSWRTRIIDYIWGELPILTTGGDEASEYLASKKCAVLLNDNSEKEVEEKIENLYKNRPVLSEMKKNILALKPEFYWENITQNLAKFIIDGKIAPDRKLLLNEKDMKINKRKKSFFERLWIGVKIIRQNGFREFVCEVKKYFGTTE